MKQFRGVFIFGILILALIGAMIIYYAAPSRTVDFRGEILSIAVAEDGAVTLCAEGAFGGDFVFKIDGGSLLTDCCGEKITASDLTVGNTVDINYRKPVFGKEDVHTVKTLKMYEK